MGEHASLGEQPAGILLVSGDVKAVSRWAQRGLTAVRLVRLDGWVAVVPTGPSLAAAPYDATPEVLLARPLPRALRPAIGLWLVGDRAVVSAHSKTASAPVRWVLWRPGSGVQQPSSMASVQLAPATARDLARVAGARAGAGPVAAALTRSYGSAVEVLQAVLEALQLPGLGLLLGTAPDPDAARDDGEVVVRPSPRSVRRFDALTTEEHAFAAELNAPR